MARTKAPQFSEEKMAEKKGIFTDKIKTLSEEATAKRSPSFKFLDEIKDEIKLALESGVYYTALAKLIEEVYSFKVSSNIIASYAKKELKIQKNKKAEPHSSGGHSSTGQNNETETKF